MKRKILNSDRYGSNQNIQQPRQQFSEFPQQATRNRRTFESFNNMGDAYELQKVSKPERDRSFSAGPEKPVVTGARIRLISSSNMKTKNQRNQSAKQVSASTQVKSYEIQNTSGRKEASGSTSNHFQQSYGSLPHYTNKLPPRNNFQSLTQITQYGEVPSRQMSLSTMKFYTRQPVLRKLKGNASVDQIEQNSNSMINPNSSFPRKLRIAPSAKLQKHRTNELQGNKQRKLKQAEQSYKFTRKQMNMHLQKGVVGIQKNPFTAVEMMQLVPEVKLDENIYPLCFKHHKLNQFTIANAAAKKARHHTANHSKKVSDQRTKMSSRVETKVLSTKEYEDFNNEDVHTDEPRNMNVIVPHQATLYDHLDFGSDHPITPYELDIQENVVESLQTSKYQPKQRTAEITVTKTTTDAMNSSVQTLHQPRGSQDMFQSMSKISNLIKNKPSKNKSNSHSLNDRADTSHGLSSSVGQIDSSIFGIQEAYADPTSAREFHRWKKSQPNKNEYQEDLDKHILTHGTRNQQHAQTADSQKSSPMQSKPKRGVTLKESLHHPSLQQFFTADSETRSGRTMSLKQQASLRQKRVHLNQQSPAKSDKRLLTSIEKNQQDAIRLNDYKESSASPAAKSSASGFQVQYSDKNPHKKVVTIKMQRNRNMSQQVRIKAGGGLHVFRDTHEEKMKRDISAKLSAQAEQYSEVPRPDHDRMNNFFGDNRRPRSSSQNNRLNEQYGEHNTRKASTRVTSAHQSSRQPLSNSQCEQRPRLNSASALKSPSKKELEIRDNLQDVIRNKETKRKDIRIKFNHKLLNLLITIPVIYAENLNDMKAACDQKFVKGCQYMVQNNYTKAIQCFLTLQKMDGVTDSFISESLSSDDSLPDSKGKHSVDSFKLKRGSIDSNGMEMDPTFSDDQKYRSIDTNMQKLRIPPHMRDLTKIVVVQEAYIRMTTSGENDQATEAQSHDEKMRQMCIFNMSVCFARCGYGAKAIEAIEMITHEKLKIAATFNQIIYLMLQLPLPYSLTKKVNEEEEILLEPINDPHTKVNRPESAKDHGKHHRPSSAVSSRRNSILSHRQEEKFGQSMTLNYAHLICEGAQYNTSKAVSLLQKVVESFAIATSPRSAIMVKQSGIEEKCTSLLHILNQQLCQKIDIQWELQKEQKVEDLMDEGLKPVTCKDDIKEASPTQVKEEAQPEQHITLKQSPIKISKLASLEEISQLDSPKKVSRIEESSLLDTVRVVQQNDEELLLKVLQLHQRFMLFQIQGAFGPQEIDGAELDEENQQVLDQLEDKKRLTLQTYQNQARELNQIGMPLNTIEQPMPIIPHGSTKESSDFKIKSIVQKSVTDFNTEKVSFEDFPFKNESIVKSARDQTETQRKTKPKNKKLTWGDWAEIDRRSVDFVKTVKDKRVDKMLGRINDMTLEDVQKAMSQESQVGVKQPKPTKQKSAKQITEYRLSEVRGSNIEHDKSFENQNDQNLAVQVLEVSDTPEEESDLRTSEFGGSITVPPQLKEAAKTQTLKKTKKAKELSDGVSQTSFSQLQTGQTQKISAPSSAQLANLRGLKRIEGLVGGKKGRNLSSFQTDIFAGSGGTTQIIAVAGGLLGDAVNEERKALEANMVKLEDADNLLFSQDLIIDTSKQRFFKMLGDEFVVNAKFLKRLDYRMDHLAQVELKKKRALMDLHVQRLRMIRDDTSYNMALKALVKCLKKQGRPITILPETDKDVKRALDEALANFKESEAFRNRLRNSEITTLVEYKRQQARSRIVDFKASFDILQKIPWLKQFGYDERQKIFNRARIVLYEPGDLIFNQFEESPRINIILRGSVEASQQKIVFGHKVIIKIPSFYDSQLFGEMAEFEALKGELTEQQLRELQMQKYTAVAQENSCILHLDKQDLNFITQRDVGAEFGQLLDFVRQCDMFKSVSLFTMLPITNNLIKKTFKLGEQILNMGEVPRGLFIVKKGYCKVGIDRIKPLEIDNEQYQNKNLKEVNFRHNSNHFGPLRKEKIKEKLDLVWDASNGFGEILGNVPNDPDIVKRMQAHERSLKRILPPERFNARKRLFIDNKFVLLDEDAKPFGDNKTAVREFLTFFHLTAKDYFGGRVLIAESSLTNEGRVLDDNGKSVILPSQLCVVADSAEVEVLIMDKSQMPLFPEEVQKEIIDKVRYVQNVERPFSDQAMENQKHKFDAWSKKRHEAVKLALMHHLPEGLQLDLDKGKVGEIKTHDDLVSMIMNRELI